MSSFKRDEEKGGGEERGGGKVFPMSIVWTGLPVLSWFCPVIGHLGVTTSKGMIHDFVGPHMINKSYTRMGFGPVLKYVPVSMSDISPPPSPDSDNFVGAWDDAVERASEKYSKMAHNLFCNNCHDHVAVVLNELNYKQKNNWNTVSLIAYLSLHSYFVSPLRGLMIYLPFLVIVCLIWLYRL